MLSKFDHISIEAISSCLPTHIERNEDLPYATDELTKVIASSGIEERRIAQKETTAADLCYQAAIDALDGKAVDRKEIGVLVFITQYPDYLLPSTAHILQERLELEQSTIVFQINEGCAGYVYGLQVAAALLGTQSKDYGLLLIGDTNSRLIEEDDKGTKPLFGDAGTATLLSKKQGILQVELGGDGKGYKDIIVEHGAFRNAIDQKPCLHMDGMNVFMFGISRVPKYIKAFAESAAIDLSQIDYLVLHQANRLMNERIVRKLGVAKEKALYSLQDCGNTSGASIPVSITTNISKISSAKHFLVAGFGVGLAWGTASFFLTENVYLNTIEYDG